MVYRKCPVLWEKRGWELIRKGREQLEPQICPGWGRVESSKALFAFAAGCVLVGLRLGIHPDQATLWVAGMFLPTSSSHGEKWPVSHQEIKQGRPVPSSRQQTVSLLPSVSAMKLSMFSLMLVRFTIRQCLRVLKQGDTFPSQPSGKHGLLLSDHVRSCQQHLCTALLHRCNHISLLRYILFICGTE